VHPFGGTPVPPARGAARRNIGKPRKDRQADPTLPE